MNLRDLIAFLAGLTSFIAIVVSLLNIHWLIEDFPNLKYEIWKKRKRKPSTPDAEGDNGDHE